MPSHTAILEVFGLFGTLAVQGGPSTEAQFDLAAKAWGMILKDVSDSDMKEAAMAYLRDEKVCQFWPQPGTLIGRIPSRQAAAVDDAHEVFGQAMTYLMNCPPRWVRPGFPHTKFHEPGPGLVPVVYPPPPWPEDRTDAINRATAAMGGLTKFTHAETGSYAAQQAEKTWKAAYQAIRKGDALAVEGAKVSHLTGPDRRMITAEAK